MSVLDRCKHWVFTSYDEEVSFFFNDKVDYVIFGNEKCPKTGRWHKQGYLCLKNRMRLSGLKKLAPSVHFEKMRGSPSEAREYCMKDGDFYERGVIPVQPGDVYKEVLRLAELGDIDFIKERYAGMYLRYKRTLDGMRKFDCADLDVPCGYWVFGKPGCGKDSNILKLKPYVKMHNKWWDGYNGEDYVVYQDLDDSDAKWIGSFLKTWSDRYAFNAETKGGVIKIRPKRFYVTSHYRLSDLFSGVLLEALDRRFHKIDFDTKMISYRPVMGFSDNLNLIDCVT